MQFISTGKQKCFKIVMIYYTTVYIITFEYFYLFLHVIDSNKQKMSNICEYFFNVQSKFHELLASV